MTTTPVAACDLPDLGPVPGLPGDGTPVVLDHDDDRNLTYTWYDRSPDPQDAPPRDKAIETSLLVVTRDGARVGHLRVSFTTPEYAAQTFPRILAWSDKAHGWPLGYTAQLRGYGNALTPEQTWVSAHRYARTNPASFTAAGRTIASWSLEERLAPDDDTIVADLAAIEADLEPGYRRWVDWMLTPWVAYSWTSEPRDAARNPGLPVVRGTGVGTRMYLLAADQLATTGRILSASDIQTPEARGLWNRLSTHPDARVTTVTKTSLLAGGKARTGPSLDHR